MKKILLYVLAFSLFTGISFVSASDEAVLKDHLKYLNDITEISWVEFNDNNVYIGFNSKPSDLRMIINGAALKGNRAIERGVHVWATAADQRGWRPGKGPYYCSATARGGRVKKSDCR